MTILQRPLSCLLVNIVLMMFFSFTAFAQSDTATKTKEITVEDIWRDYVFYPESVPGFNFQKDGKHYTRLEDNAIKQYDLTTGKFTKILFSGSETTAEGFNGEFENFTFSDDEQKILIRTDGEAIYRYSVKAKYFVWDGKALQPLSESGKQSDATFSPTADKVAYSIDNNLYYKDLKSGKETQITKDGKFNEIINGTTDWVYEEEFGFTRAFQWSPDGEKIAFIRFDESRVPFFTMTLFQDDAYPVYQTFKYPKVGADNSVVSVYIYHLKSQELTEVNIGRDFEYIPRIKWSNDPDKLCITIMNRHQNQLELLLADAHSGNTATLLKEKNPYYIDIHDNLTFLKDGKHFLWTSEMDGFNHIYLYNMQGKPVRQITRGDYDVTAFYGLDEKRELIYFQAAAESPLRREIYSVGLMGKKMRKLSTSEGINSAQFSSTFDYFVNTFSTANRAATYSVHDREGKLIRTIVDNSRIAVLQKEYGTSPVNFFSFKTAADSSGKEWTLNGWMIKPPNFDSRKKYPVLMYVYGGPGSQTAQDRFGGFNYWWHQLLAQKGYIVVSVDNRGTGARGQAFKKVTYRQLGKYETIDQIAAAKYLAAIPYVDAERIGIWGWSYGGYMSSLCILKGNDVFKSAIAVAPVTNWKWYDTIYTERYMRTSKENPDGYADNSPVYFADRLKGNYLIIHGMADDNVHFQNTSEMVNALIMANKQFDTYFYPNRNHGIYGGPTRLHLYTKMTNFILDKL